MEGILGRRGRYLYVEPIKALEQTTLFLTYTVTSEDDLIGDVITSVDLFIDLMDGESGWTVDLRTLRL
jgi:hypothetical protein